jgi:hypothetical protein
MMMVYNSDSFAVMQFDLREEGSNNPLARGGFEIVDKFSRKEIFIEGAVAEAFRQGVEALVEAGPSEEALDEFIGRYTELAQQSVMMH